MLPEDNRSSSPDLRWQRVCEPPVGLLYSLPQGDLRLPPEPAHLAHVQKLAWGAIGLSDIERDFAFVAHNFPYELSELPYAHVLANPDIYGLLTGVGVHKEEAGVRQVIYVQKLPPRPPRPPIHNLRLTPLLGFVKPAQEGRKHVTVAE